MDLTFLHHSTLQTLAMWLPGWWELVIILVMVLIIFGPRNLPKLMGLFGHGVGQLRKASNDLADSVLEGKDSEQKQEKKKEEVKEEKEEQ